MTQFLKIEKNGDIKPDEISNIDNLYKKCGFRKNDGFDVITEWKTEDDDGKIITVELWGRITGKENLKNNYQFPNPLNKPVYGNCILIQSPL